VLCCGVRQDDVDDHAHLLLHPERWRQSHEHAAHVEQCCIAGLRGELQAITSCLQLCLPLQAVQESQLGPHGCHLNSYASASQTQLVKLYECVQTPELLDAASDVYQKAL
jgi:hypothetical protein